MNRPDLDNRRLTWLVCGTILAIALYFLLLPGMPEAWRTPGSPELYLMGVSGAVLVVDGGEFLDRQAGQEHVFAGRVVRGTC